MIGVGGGHIGRGCLKGLLLGEGAHPNLGSWESEKVVEGMELQMRMAEGRRSTRRCLSESLPSVQSQPEGQRFVTTKPPTTTLPY